MATVRVHSKAIERQFDGNSVNLESAGALEMGIVTETSLDADTDILYSSLTPVATATGWTGPVTLTNVTASLDGSFNLVIDADDPAQIPQDASGFSDGGSLVVYIAASDYILWSYTPDTTFGNVSSAIDITFNGSGLINGAI